MSVVLCAVKTSRISDPIAFTLGLAASVEARNSDRLVSRAALERAVPFVRVADPGPLPPAFFQAVNQIRLAQLRGLTS